MTQKARWLNRLRFIFDRRLTVVDVLDRAVESHGDAALFHFDDDFSYTGLQSPVTPRALLAFANRFANALVHQASMQRFDRVAIYKRNGGDYFFLGVSVMRAGGIAVPINGGMAPPDVEYYLKYTGTRVLVTDRVNLLKLKQAGVSLSDLRCILVTDAPDDSQARALGPMLAASPCEFAPVSPASDEDVLIVHTSGTTGFPKGLIHTSGTLVAGIKGQLKIEPIFSKDIALSAAPFNHFINYLGLLSALAANVPTWLIADAQPDRVFSLIDRERISVVFCFPHTYLAMVEQHLLDRYDLGSVRIWIAGADSSHEAHIREFVRKGAFLRLFGIPLVSSAYIDTLGSSEVGFAALFRFAIASSKLYRRYVGHPTFAGPAVKIADERGNPLPAGSVGRLMVKGPTLFKGYWNAHEKAHGTIIDGWWWTGDVGYRDAWGRYFHMDRGVDIIHAEEGEVYTLLLEEELLKCAGVAEAVVIGTPAPAGRMVPHAFVQPKAGRQLDSSAVRNEVNARLGSHGKIAAVYVVNEVDIPRGLTGKVLKRVMRDRLRADGLKAFPTARAA